MKKYIDNNYDRSFIEQAFLERKEQLIVMRREAEKSLKNLPPGTLRISCSNGRTQYYYRETPSDRRGKYLPTSKEELARQLAQKGYEEQVLEAALQEIQAINAYEARIPDSSPEDIYMHLSEKRRALVEPMIETDELFVQRWKSVLYTGKDFAPDSPKIYTGQGDRVRSKSEVIIADLLNREGIPYRYEFPLSLSGIGIIYPDFTVLNVRLRKEMYWEHFGMMDDPEYAEKAVRKISEYKKNGLFPGEDLIITAETRSFPVNSKEIRMMIDRYLKS